MTTKNSPLRVLKAQADKIAKTLKAAERGEEVGVAHEWKIAAARKEGSVKFAIFMDDKMLKIEMAWTTIRDTSEAGISEYIMKQMRESRETTQ